MNLNILQLSNGDIIIGEQIEYDKLMNVFYIGYTRVEGNNDPVLSLTPCALYTKNNTITINYQTISWKAKPNEYMVKDYMTALDNMRRYVASIEESA